MNATADITQGNPGGIGAPTEHRVRCRSALDTIAVVSAFSAIIWILDANVSKDVAHAATAAVFAVVSVALAFEVLTIAGRPFANQMGVLDRVDSLIPVLTLFSGFTLSIFLI